jgi:hypothetical protein
LFLSFLTILDEFQEIILCAMDTLKKERAELDPEQYPWHLFLIVLPETEGHPNSSAAVGYDIAQALGYHFNFMYETEGREEDREEWREEGRARREEEGEEQEEREERSDYRQVDKG